MRGSIKPVSAPKVHVILAPMGKDLPTTYWTGRNGVTCGKAWDAVRQRTSQAANRLFDRACQCLVLAAMSGLIVSGAQAQTTKKAASPAAASGSYAGTCSIAEFRTLALSTHDPQERSELVTQWLKVNASTCSISQILLISSNRPQWLGSSNSVKVAGLFDQIIETKLKNDPVALKYMYGSEGAAPAGGSRRGNEEASGGAMPAAQGTAGASAPGMSMQAVGSVAAPGPISGAPAPAAASNINISMGAPPPAEDMSRKLPLDSEPKPVFPPERGNQMKNYFGKLRTEMIRNYFMENSSPGNCPDGLTFSKTVGCESKFPVAWKFGEALPPGTKSFPIPEPLLSKLNFYPGYQFLRVGPDVLALEKDSGKVADAVTNLGKSN
jgi:hypothetical protein